MAYPGKFRRTPGSTDEAYSSIEDHDNKTGLIVSLMASGSFDRWDFAVSARALIAFCVLYFCFTRGSFGAGKRQPHPVVEM